MPTTCPECGHPIDEHGSDQTPALVGCDREHRDPDLGAYPFRCTCTMSAEAIAKRAR